METPPMNINLIEWADPDTRTIYLFGEINEESSAMFVRVMDVFEFINKKYDAMITVKLSTDGGDLFSMFKIYDRMRSSTCRISTVSSGGVMSAGILIAMAGDKGDRYAYENTQFMYHKGSFDVSDEYNNGITTVEQWDLMNEVALKLVAERSKKTIRYWRNLEKSVVDKYFTATKARAVGIVDHVISNKKG